LFCVRFFLIEIDIIIAASDGNSIDSGLKQIKKGPFIFWDEYPALRDNMMLMKDVYN
jgi:hypothetical protein